MDKKISYIFDGVIRMTTMNEILQSSLTIGATGGIVRAFNKKYSFTLALGSVFTGMFFALYVAEPIAVAYLPNELFTPFIACSSLIGYEIFNAIYKWILDHIDWIMNKTWEKVAPRILQ